MRLAKGCSTYLTFPFAIFGILLTFGFIFDSRYVSILSILFFIAWIGMTVFFRDPDLPVDEGIISSADGVVIGIDRSGESLIIKVFMNVWNIHVNRFPMDGRVISMVHREGGHVPAFNKDAESNERVITELETEIGGVRIVQIAGAVARRIVPYCSEGQHVRKGERMGIIRLGSRVDLHLPINLVKVVIEVGNKVRPGQKVAVIKSGNPGEDNR